LAIARAITASTAGDKPWVTSLGRGTGRIKWAINIAGSEAVSPYGVLPVSSRNSEQPRE
jgi:hypothetical protein